MHPILFTLTLLISVQPEQYIRLTEEAAIYNCTVTELIEKCVNRKLSHECTCGLIEFSKRDEGNTGGSTSSESEAKGG